MNWARRVVEEELAKRRWDGSVIGSGTCSSAHDSGARCQLNQGHPPSVKHRHAMRNGGKDVYLLEW